MIIMIFSELLIIEVRKHIVISNITRIEKPCNRNDNKQFAISIKHFPPIIKKLITFEIFFQSEKKHL